MQTKILGVILDGIQKVTFVTCIIVVLVQFDALMVVYNYLLRVLAAIVLKSYFSFTKIQKSTLQQWR